MGVKKKRQNEVKDNIIKDPLAVTWTENYSDQIEYVWNKLPNISKNVIATLAIFIMGISINGEWLHIVVHIAKQFGYSYNESISNNVTFNWSNITLQSLKMNNITIFWFWAVFVSYFIYFSIGGFLHWYFYIRQRDRPEDWKCQPQKWLSPELEKHEILFGSLTLFLNSTFSAILACFVYNGGYSTIYYKLNDYPLWWLFLQVPVVFIYQDYVTYLLHRLYHTPFLYKHFHKLHHKYKQPTAFSVTAIHPFEALHIQATLVLPIFLIPLHWGPFYAISLYIYYHGIIDHSGVNFKAYWWQPWQPDAIFHDNHHQYFHVNFGFNCFIWDKLHGTYRRKDRVYTEDIFYGKGKSLSEVTEEELKTDLEERLSENPKAYRKNKLEFNLTKSDLKVINKKNKKNMKLN